jgi:glutamate-1-semialdehyde 2,1-aminomutase
MSTPLAGRGNPTTAADGTGQRLYRRARTLIPGGTQLLSKRPEMFLPEQWPAYYERAKGIEVWDLDGRRYLDFATSGIGAPILGFADDDVDAAVTEAIRKGSMTTLNCHEEVALAEDLLELHPWAEMVRFARGGGEMLAVAVRIARASTGRDTVAFCGYHGWPDWYLAANLHTDTALDGHLLRGLEPAGVPRGLRGTVLPFAYNDVEALRAVASAAGESLAAIVMEPSRSRGPAPGFLEAVREVATRIGAVMIMDEVTSGFRLCTGGVHLRYGIEPDMAAFAKALGNGYPVAALVGRRDVMLAAERTFISSTSWTERIGPVAARATIRKHRDRGVADHLVAIGTSVQEGWKKAAADAELRIHVDGMPPLSHFEFVRDPSVIGTLFTQEMLDRGYLAGTSFYPTLSHTPEEAERYLENVDEVFRLLARAISEESVRQRLRGPVRHTGFQRLT